MKTDSEWKSEVISTDGDAAVMRAIRNIQADALYHAAVIAGAAKVPSGTHDWNEGFYCAVRHISRALRQAGDHVSLK